MIEVEGGRSQRTPGWCVMGLVESQRRQSQRHPQSKRRHQQRLPPPPGHRQRLPPQPGHQRQ